MSGKKLFLFPCPIEDEKLDTLSKNSLNQLHKTSVFVVERAKTARRFIKVSGHPLPIDSLEIIELDKHDPSVSHIDLEKTLKSHNRIGVISEAGCPGIADPGAEIVQIARKHSFQIIPLVGPSSIILSLMASGLNGQNFRFLGYLPVKDGMLRNKLKQIESEIIKDKTAQIFIETPYRNQKLFDAILKNINQNIILNISSNLTGNQEYTNSLSIRDWKKKNPNLFQDKKPCVFILGQF